MACLGPKGFGHAILLFGENQGQVLGPAACPSLAGTALDLSNMSHLARGAGFHRSVAEDQRIWTDGVAER
jgi:hypothetical protein